MTVVAAEERALGDMLMLAFAGTEAPPEVTALLQARPIGGVTLFRSLNARDPAQVRRLTAALQAAAAVGGGAPLLIAADQEGGQLVALPGGTDFPGNMALGATDDAALAERVGHALGLELAAMGVNVDYAPVCDVQSNPANPVIGIRAFGEDPVAAGRLAAALVTGLQAAGVAATAKHFPGHGDTATDSHLAVPVVGHDRGRLEQIELPPFAAAIAAGVRLVMTAHVALPGITGDPALPATLAPAVLGGLLRTALGFRGPIVSDALDMGAVAAGADPANGAVAAAVAGVDLLLLGPAGPPWEAVESGLRAALASGRLAPDAVASAAARVRALKAWLAVQPQPRLDVVGCAAHRALAQEVAARAITLVRDAAGLLPLRLAPGARVAAVVPRPADLTPADTSSYVTPGLGAAFRRYHPKVDEIVVSFDPDPAEVAARLEQLRGYDLVVAGTINATVAPGQAALANGLLAAGVPAVAVALRLPYDLAMYPTAPTYLCTYGILEPSITALAAALWGAAPCPGRLPVPIPGLYPRGHGLVPDAG